MIDKIVITKIHRAFFSPYQIVEVMIGFFDKQGQLQGSQLLPASLFDKEIREGQEVNFKKDLPTPFYDLGTQTGPDAIG